MIEFQHVLGALLFMVLVFIAINAWVWRQ